MFYGITPLTKRQEKSRLMCLPKIGQCMGGWTLLQPTGKSSAYWLPALTTEADNYNPQIYAQVDRKGLVPTFEADRKGGWTVGGVAKNGHYRSLFLEVTSTDITPKWPWESQ